MSAETYTATTFAGGVADGAPVVGKQEVRIVDHGTGVGSSVAAALDFSPAVVDLRALPLVDTAAVSVELHPTEHPPWVRIDGPGVDQVTHRKYDLADHVLGLLTRHRLDTATERGWLHAGAVDLDGRTVVLVGESAAGKSTMTAHLVAAGADLLTDEQLSVHPTAEVVCAATRPIVVKPQGVEFVPPAVRPAEPLPDHTHLFLRPDELGRSYRPVGRPAVVVVLRRRDDSPLAVSPLRPTEALEALCINSLDVDGHALAALPSLTWLAASTHAFRLCYSDAGPGAAELVELVRRLSPRAPAQWAVDPPEGRDPGAAREDDQVVARSETVVTCWLDDESVLFEPASKQVLRLNASASAVWSALPVPDRELPDTLRPLTEELRSAGFIVTPEGS